MFRKLKYYIAVLPFVGRNSYERLNARLDRQIQIREAKRLEQSTRKKSKKSFIVQDSYFSSNQYFFDKSEKIDLQHA